MVQAVVTLSALRAVRKPHVTPNCPKARYVAAMTVALELAEQAARLAKAGLESAHRDWEGEARLTQEMARAAATTAGQLARAGTAAHVLGEHPLAA